MVKVLRNDALTLNSTRLLTFDGYDDFGNYVCDDFGDDDNDDFDDYNHDDFGDDFCDFLLSPFIQNHFFMDDR